MLKFLKDNKWTAIWRLMQVAMFIFGAAVMGSFIMEEAIQTCGLPIFMLCGDDNWEEAQYMLEKTEPTMRGCIKGIRSLSRINFISGGAFRAYAQSVELQIEGYKTSISIGMGKTGFRVPADPRMTVYVTRNGRYFHPSWSEVVSQYTATPISLAEAQRRGLKPASTWREI